MYLHYYGVQSQGVDYGAAQSLENFTLKISIQLGSDVSPRFAR